MKEHEAMKAEEERAALILAEEAQATRERLISLQALERLADEERAVVDLLKLQSKKKDQLREEHQKRMNHVSEHVDRHRQAAHEVDTFLVSHFQSLPVSLEESGVGDLISTRQVSVRDSDGSFVTARQSASSGNLASVRLQTTATVIAPTNTDIALNDTRCDNADEGNVYEKDDDKELSFLTTKTTLHSSLGRVSTAAQTDNLSMEQPTLQLESHLGSINPPSQESQTEPVTETVTPMKVQHRNQHTKSSFVMSPATLASTTAEVLALLESPIPVPIHVPVSSALNQSLPHSRMHTPLESHSLTKSSSKYIETPSNRNRKVTFASPKITPVTNPKATHVSSSKSIHTTPKSIQHSVSVETKENRQSTPASANQSYSTKSRSMSMSMSMVKTPHSAALKQPPMRISTYARTPYSAASSTGNRYTSSPSRVFSSTDTPVITSAADIDSTTPTVPSPISESASAFVTAQKFPSRRQKQHEELYHSYQSYQEQLAEASTPAHNIVAQSDMYADSPELLHLSSWSASCYPGMNMPDTPALKAALADSETTADSFQRYASAYSEHYSAAPLASLAELSDDESEYGFAPASENINSVQDEMLQVSNHDPETELDGQPHGDDDLDRIFDDVFETTDEDNNETEIDSDDLRVYYDSLQFSVKSKRTNETSFMPRDLSLLSLSTGTGTGSPNHYQVPANQNNGRVRAYDNLSLTQYGNEVVAEEVLRQLLINEQLTDNM